MPSHVTFASQHDRQHASFLSLRCMASCLEATVDNLPCFVQVVGVNEWDEDVLTIGTSDDSAQNLPLVHDDYGCPGLQVCPTASSLC